MRYKIPPIDLKDIVVLGMKTNYTAVLIGTVIVSL